MVRLLFILLLCATSPLFAQTKPAASDLHATPSPQLKRTPVNAATAEARASAAFIAARAAGTLSLRSFLERMPKGADLHMHLSGAVYAETLLCVDPAKLLFHKNVGTTRSLPAQAVCSDGQVSAASVFAPNAQRLRDALIDSFSMRSFTASAGVSGHDQFFATFERFSLLGKQHAGEWLDEVTTRAAVQNEQYLEVMYTPAFTQAAQLASEIGWPSSPRLETGSDNSLPDDLSGTTPAELSALRDKLLTGGLRDEIATDRLEFAQALSARNHLEHCGEINALPACSVQVRFLFQVLRAFPPEHVFAQTLAAFEIAASDPDVVGVNFVMPEDAYLAMSEYHRQMSMLDYLHSVYPLVHLSLHAGELAPGLVPPAGLRFHIREAVVRGHAERIGHGVDVMYETDPQQLLQDLSRRHVMVEINLTSNEVILGITPRDHPLPLYRAAHVPIALSTDDEGVSRIDLTHEYTRAASEYGLSYLELKQIARTSLEHSFLPGPSLWERRDDFTDVIPACSHQPRGVASPTSACGTYLQASSHAAQQWELERRYQVFESSLPRP